MPNTRQSALSWVCFQCVKDARNDSTCLPPPHCRPSSKPDYSFLCLLGLQVEAPAQMFREEQEEPLVNFLMTYVVDTKVKHHYFHPRGGGKPHNTLETCEISKCKLWSLKASIWSEAFGNYERNAEHALLWPLNLLIAICSLYSFNYV